MVPCPSLLQPLDQTTSQCLASRTAAATSIHGGRGRQGRRGVPARAAMGVQGQRIVPAAFGEGGDGAGVRAQGAAPGGGLRLHARRHVPGALPRQPRRPVRRAGGDRRHCVESADFLREVGLPSHVAAFSQTEASVLRNKPNNFLNILGMGSGFSKQENYRRVEIKEASGSSSRHLCNISLPLNEASRGSHKRNKWMGPAIKMSLPSFSGQTEDHPELLKYSCKVECRVRPVTPAKIWSPKTAEPEECSDGMNSSTGSSDSDAQKQCLLVLLSRPILALEFSSLRMHVDAPKIVAPHPKKKEVRYSST